MYAILSLFTLCVAICVPSANAQDFNANTKKSSVFIATYDSKGYFSGWGSGFFVDEGIVITNKHVIDESKYFRIFATKDDFSVDLECYKDITLSDVKINLDNDVAYIRVYVNCDHGIVQFANNDPPPGQKIGIIGYPNKGTVSASMELSISTGSVTGETEQGWLSTDAYIHFGNSGGPVVENDRVVGVAVAKGLTKDGDYVEGYFVPTSSIVEGLLYANTSTFGYTYQDLQKNNGYNAEPESFGTEGDPFDPIRTTKFATNSLCTLRLGEGAESTGYGGCQCIASYHISDDKKSCEPGAEGYIDPYNSYLQRSSISSRYSTSSQVSNLSSPPNPNTSSTSISSVRIFTDYSQYDSGYEAVVSLQESGIIDGYPDGTFRPKGNINRAELLKILVEGFYHEEVRGETHCFPDVAEQWFAPYVCAAKRLGWISGYPDGTFRPANSLNRAEGIKIVLSSLTTHTRNTEYLPYDVASDSWFAPFVGKALEKGILASRGSFRPETGLTREDAAVWIWNGTRSVRSDSF